MRRFLFTLFVLASCTAPTSPEVAVDRQSLKATLAAFEGGVSAERLAGLEGDVPAALMALSEDRAEKPYYRARAFAALSHYPEERVFLHLENALSRAESLGFVVLPTAIDTLSAFNDLHPKEVAELLAPLAEKNSIVVKEATIRVLTKNRSVFAKELLAKMKLRETDPTLKNLLP